jgi:hypothetical protein
MRHAGGTRADDFGGHAAYATSPRKPRNLNARHEMATPAVHESDAASRAGGLLAISYGHDQCARPATARLLARRILETGARWKRKASPSPDADVDPSLHNCVRAVIDPGGYRRQRRSHIRVSVACCVVVSQALASAARHIARMCCRRRRAGGADNVYC